MAKLVATQPTHLKIFINQRVEKYQPVKTYPSSNESSSKLDQVHLTLHNFALTIKDIELLN
jgi:hypothetical protein